MMNTRLRVFATGALALLSFSVTPASGQVGDLVKLFSTANPAVVVVTAYSPDGTPLAQGSGFVISPQALVVTNNHVIKDADAVAVRRPGSEPVFATEVRAASKDWDLAILRIEVNEIPALSLAPRGAAKVGMRVVAIGSPLGLENTISEGIISGIRGGSLLQITTPISPGSSGGVLLTMDGLALGATTLTLEGGQNVNFAVSSDQIRSLLSKSGNGPPPRRLHALARTPDPRTRTTGDVVYYQAFRSLLEVSCTDIKSVDLVMAQAIQVGAPIYNAGFHLGCYRVYEGAAYKALHVLRGKCQTIEEILTLGLTQAESAPSATEKAWIMRRTFDLILGEPTRYK